MACAPEDVIGDPMGGLEMVTPREIWGLWPYGKIRDSDESKMEAPLESQQWCPQGRIRDPIGGLGIMILWYVHNECMGWRDRGWTLHGTIRDCAPMEDKR